MASRVSDAVWREYVQTIERLARLGLEHVSREQLELLVRRGNESRESRVKCILQFLIELENVEDLVQRRLCLHESVNIDGKPCRAWHCSIENIGGFSAASFSPPLRVELEKPRDLHHRHPAFAASMSLSGSGSNLEPEAAGSAGSFSASSRVDRATNTEPVRRSQPFLADMSDAENDEWVVPTFQFHMEKSFRSRSGSVTSSPMTPRRNESPRRSPLVRARTPPEESSMTSTTLGVKKSITRHKSDDIVASRRNSSGDTVSSPEVLPAIEHIKHQHRRTRSQSASDPYRPRRGNMGGTPEPSPPPGHPPPGLRDSPLPSPVGTPPPAGVQTVQREHQNGSRRASSTIYDRHKQWLEKSKLKQEQLRQEQDNKEMDGVTFQPQFVANTPPTAKSKIEEMIQKGGDMNMLRPKYMSAINTDFERQRAQKPKRKFRLRLTKEQRNPHTNTHELVSYDVDDKFFEFFEMNPPREIVEQMVQSSAAPDLPPVQLPSISFDRFQMNLRDIVTNDTPTGSVSSTPREPLGAL